VLTLILKKKHFNEHVHVKITAIARGCKKYTPLVSRHETNKCELQSYSTQYTNEFAAAAAFLGYYESCVCYAFPELVFYIYFNFVYQIFRVAPKITIQRYEIEGSGTPSYWNQSESLI
jgi:hypothetical protein